MSPDVYILKDGLPVVNRSSGDKTLENVNMTAGFFQAILQFSKMQVGENLEAINMSDSLFYFSTKESYTFIIRLEKSSPRTGKEINQMLTQLSQRFFEKFPSAAKWDGDVSCFESFSPICDDILSTKAPPPDKNLPRDANPEQDLIPVSTVIVAEASKKLSALVESGNSNFNAKKYKKAKEDFDGAIGFLTLMPELVPIFPSMKEMLLEQMKEIDVLLAQGKETKEVQLVCGICHEKVDNGRCTFCGGWICSSCNETNVALVDKCRKCSKERWA